MATTKMTVQFTRNDKGNPPGKLADAELHFTDGPLEGLKLIGFAIWDAERSASERDVPGVQRVGTPIRRGSGNRRWGAVSSDAFRRSRAANPQQGPLTFRSVGVSHAPPLADDGYHRQHLDARQRRQVIALATSEKLGHHEVASLRGRDARSITRVLHSPPAPSLSFGIVGGALAVVAGVFSTISIAIHEMNYRHSPE
jgi:hypothetical protein